MRRTSAGRVPARSQWALGSNWEYPAPWQYVLNGDVLEPNSIRVVMSGGSRKAAEIEQRGRLYRRMVEAVCELQNSDVALVPGWEQMALDFANLYAPPVGQSSISPLDRFPVARYGNEALLIWWTMVLSEAITNERLFRAVEAAVQVRELLPALRDMDSSPGVSRGVEWCVSNLPGWLSPGAEPAWCGVTTRCLPRDEARRQVSAITAAPETDDRGRRLYASHVACGVLDLRLAGVRLSAVPDYRGSTAEPTISVYFLSPLSRIWFGLWEDTFRIAFRPCANCDHLFFATRRDGRFCSTRCRNAFGSRKHRRREPG